MVQAKPLASKVLGCLVCGFDHNSHFVCVDVNREEEAVSFVLKFECCEHLLKHTFRFSKGDVIHTIESVSAFAFLPEF